MNTPDQTSEPAQILYQSGLTAFQSRTYKEAIDYFKRAQALGLNFVDRAEADRFIGSAYLKLKNGGMARKYLRRATAIGLFSGNSIFMLAQAEEQRSSFYKWIKGVEHTEKTEELLDWFSNNHIPDQERLKIVAFNAFKNKKWHKAIVLYETLKILDKSNIQYQINSILACYYVGEIYRAQVEIDNLFSNTQTSLEALLGIRAEISMIFGEFKQSKEYYIGFSDTTGKDLTSIQQALDICIRADEVSEEFHGKAMLYMIRGYFSKSYINSIDSIDHFELMLNAVSTYFEYFQSDQKKNAQDLLGRARGQHEVSYGLYSQKPKVNISESPKLNEVLTPFERAEKRQKSEMEALTELMQLSSVINTSLNLSAVNQYDRQICKSGISLKMRLWIYKWLLSTAKGLLLLIPTVVFVDGLYSALTGNSLLTIVFPSISSNSLPGWLQIFIAVSWFLLLIIADEVLEEKINAKLVDTLRETLVKYSNLISYMLVSREAVYAFLRASQPIPHLDMGVSELLQIGLNTKKPWEVRLGALTIAERKVNSDDVTPYKEPLKTQLNSDREELRFVSARLLAIGKMPESLPIIELELQGAQSEFNDETAFHLALQALAKYGDNSSLTILRDFAIRNLDSGIKVVGCVEAIKLLPPELRVSTVAEIIDSSIGKGIGYRTFLEVLGGLGDPAVKAIVTIFNNHHENIKITDRSELILAILNSGSQLGNDIVKNWLIASEPTEGERASLFDMNYDFLIANKKYDLIREIALDSNLSVNIRKRAISKIAILEKERLQDIVFSLWQNDEFNGEYLKILGDIGSRACAEKLLVLLENNRTAAAEPVLNTEHIYIFSSLALCGDPGKNILRSILNTAESTKSQKSFAAAALYGVNQNDLTSLRKLKRLLLDSGIDTHHRSHAILISGWCVSRGEEAYFKINQHSLPSPKKYYKFLNWVKTNPKLPDEVRQYADFELSNSSIREHGRVLWVPTSYSRLEIFLEKLKAKFSKKKQ